MFDERDAAQDAREEEARERGRMYAEAYVRDEFGKSADYIFGLAERSAAIGEALTELGLRTAAEGFSSPEVNQARRDLDEAIASHELAVVDSGKHARDLAASAATLAKLHIAEDVLRGIVRGNHNARRLAQAQSLVGELLEEETIAFRAGTSFDYRQPEAPIHGASARRLLATFRQYAEHHEAFKAEPGTIDHEAWQLLQELGK